MEAVQLTPTSPVQSSQDTPISDGISSDTQDYKPLYDKFQASQNPRTDRIMQEIWDWAKSQAPLKDKDSILWEVTKLSNRIGSPHYGEKPWVKIISYVSTFNKMQESEKRLKEMES